MDRKLGECPEEDLEEVIEFFNNKKVDAIRSLESALNAQCTARSDIIERALQKLVLDIGMESENYKNFDIVIQEIINISDYCCKEFAEKVTGKSPRYLVNLINDCKKYYNF